MTGKDLLICIFVWHVGGLITDEAEVPAVIEQAEGAWEALEPAQQDWWEELAAQVSEIFGGPIQPHEARGAFKLIQGGKSGQAN